jgi:hypothetical protein
MLPLLSAAARETILPSPLTAAIRKSAVTIAAYLTDLRSLASVF